VSGAAGRSAEVLRAGGGVGVEVGTAGHVRQSHIYLVCVQSGPSKGSAELIYHEPAVEVRFVRNFQAYCFVCEKRVSALTILDKEGLWKALDSGADVEVIHTGVRGTEGRAYR